MKRGVQLFILLLVLSTLIGCSSFSKLLEKDRSDWVPDYKKWTCSPDRYSVNEKVPVAVSRCVTPYGTLAQIFRPAGSETIIMIGWGFVKKNTGSWVFVSGSEGGVYALRMNGGKWYRGARGVPYALTFEQHNGRPWYVFSVANDDGVSTSLWIPAQ